MPKPLPNIAELEELFSANFITGQLFWKPRKGQPKWNDKFAGQEAGGLDARGYRYVQLGRGNRCLVHRIIYKMAYGTEPAMIDHINRNRSDNSLSNLREADNTINKHNQKLSRNNSSGCTGVYYVKARNRWIVKSPKINGVSKNVGYFKSKEEAIQHRINLYGESYCF